MHKTVVLKVNAKCLVHLHPGIYRNSFLLKYNTLMSSSYSKFYIILANYTINSSNTQVLVQYEM